MNRSQAAGAATLLALLGLPVPGAGPLALGLNGDAQGIGLALT